MHGGQSRKWSSRRCFRSGSRVSCTYSNSSRSTSQHPKTDPRNFSKEFTMDLMPWSRGTIRVEHVFRVTVCEMMLKGLRCGLFVAGLAAVVSCAVMADDITTHKPNRLIHETSPYLLQHAYNPVDWRPWGEEAFALAVEEDKPILLSVGYSACHWCHVMERESFENDEIAALMNRDFICIKVDREERPDVDAIYMNAVQLMTGQGGGPMAMFLKPEGKPFYGCTYYPPDDEYG